MTGHTLRAYPLSPEGRERVGGQHSVPMVARPPCDAACPVAASLRAWGACGEGRAQGGVSGLLVSGWFGGKTYTGPPGNWGAGRVLYPDCVMGLWMCLSDFMV